jgi:hypothetical protein
MGVVAVVIGIFFVAGLFVGGIAVIALPALRPKGFGRPRRRDRAGRPGGPVDRVSQDAARWEDEAADDRPRWPGDADGEDSGR